MKHLAYARYNLPSKPHTRTMSILDNSKALFERTGPR